MHSLTQDGKAHRQAARLSFSWWECVCLAVPNLFVDSVQCDIRVNFFPPPSKWKLIKGMRERRASWWISGSDTLQSRQRTGRDIQLSSVLIHYHSLTSYQALYQWPVLWTFIPVCRALWKAKNSSSCSSIILMLEHWLFWTSVFWWWKPGAVKLQTFTSSTLHWCILTTHNLNSLPRAWVIYF